MTLNGIMVVMWQRWSKFAFVKCEWRHLFYQSERNALV